MRRLLLGSHADAADSAALRVRDMRRADLEAVIRIEAASHPNAWSAGAFGRVLKSGRASAHVLERGSTLVGFFVVLRKRDHLHVANLAVSPVARRTGVGTAALHAIEGIARAHGLCRVELEVRETNLAAQLLYRAAGYRAVEIRRSYYGDQDAYRMTKPVC